MGSLPLHLAQLAFSLQAAYAAPVILLAPTRQADRDKAVTEADVAHREDPAAAGLARQDAVIEQSQHIQASRAATPR